MVHDQTGLVTVVDEAPGGLEFPIDRGMTTLAILPNSVLLHWIGGACDERVEVAVSSEGGMTFIVKSITAPGACDLGGVTRAVLIHLMNPVDTSRTTVRFEP